MHTKAMLRKYVAPLFNFRMDEHSVRLPDSLVIRGLMADEMEQLYEAAQQVKKGISLDGSEGGFALCCEEHVSYARQVSPKSARERLADVEQRFRRAVTALRLLGPGDVGIGVVGIWNEDSRFRPHLMAGVPAGNAGYWLEPAHVPDLKHLVNVLESSLSQTKGLRRAVSRFNLAYERQSDEDKLIDFWVALEGLFLRKEMGELSFKGAVRIAHFLGQSTDGRWRLYQEAKKSYTVRSKIVHGERVDEAKLEAARSQTEEIIRAALRAVVLDPKSLDLVSLDKRAVQGVPVPARWGLQVT